MPWPPLGCESAMPTFGPEEFFKGCSGIALQEGLAVLVVPFSLWKQGGVRGGGDRAGFSRVGVEPRCFFFPNGLIVGQEAHSEHRIMLFDVILKVNHRSLALPSLEGAKYQSSSPGNP